MKSAFFLFLLASAGAFQAPFPGSLASTKLKMAGSSKPEKKGNPLGELLRSLANNFEPFHGHGSLENDLDGQWEAQQEILRNRRSHHIDKTYLKKKYKDPDMVKFDGRVGDSSESSFGRNLSP